MRTPLRIFLAMAAALAAGAVPAPAGPAPVVRPEPLKVRPHDAGAFTEGLVWSRGRVFESSGLYGRSWVREIRLATGAAIRTRPLAGRYFGEGLALAGDRLYQLTWRERTALVWDRDTLRPVRMFGYAGEGWGLAPLGRRLVMSDGTATLRFLDPATFRVSGRVRVTDGGVPVRDLNELEVVRGEVWANVWLTNDVVVIDPSTGRVRVRLDLSGLRRRLPREARVDVLNGIAWDRARDRVLVTGKYWPRLFELPSRVGPPG